MARLIKRFLRGSSPGQSLLEYSLLIAFLAIAALGVFSGFADNLGNAWDSAGSTIDNAGDAATTDDGGGTGGANGGGGFHHDHSWWHGWGHHGG